MEGGIEAGAESLERAIAGELIWPGHPAYESARRLWNGLIDKRPRWIVRCANERDVVAAVNFARDRGVELSVRGGGHNVAGKAISEGGLVVDLSPMRRIAVDVPGRTVTVQGGATLKDVDRSTLQHGLVVPLGVVSATGVAGLTLHGGYGWNTRKHGLSVDNLLEARIVTADGKVLRAAEEENPDLFWALRGGGGNFGVVTSFTFRAHPLRTPVWFNFVLYPVERADAVLRLFCDYIVQAPEELGAIGVHWSAPPLPEVPRALQGSPVVILLGVYSGPDEQAERVLEPLRHADATPLVDLTRPVPFVEVQQALDEDYPDDRLYYWKSVFLPEASDQVLSVLKRAAASRPSPITSIDLWGLGGGAASRVPVDATAFAQRDAPFLAALEANWDGPEHSRDNIEWARATYRELAHVSGGRTYLNFPGFAEGGEALVRDAYGPNWDRLRAIKAKYDPDNFFRGNFNVEPRPAH
ncbi:MAG: FAD-binding oxidoreductase [Myxococcaceae bacterium]